MARTKRARSRREVNVGIRLTQAERDAWRAAANADGRNLSNWIIRRCNGNPTTAPVRG